MTLFARLDAYGADDPDNNEGFYEDRCSVCDKPRIDHFESTRCQCGHPNYVHMAYTGECVNCGGCDEFRPRRGGPAKWSHRWHALIDMTIRRWP